MSNYLFKNPVPPFSNINQQLTNPFATNNPIGFSSNETNKQFGLPVPQNNIQAANSYIPGITSGGGKRSTRKSHTKKNLKRKIKNIVNKYKMKGGKKTKSSVLKRLKKTLGLKGGKKSRKTMRKSRRHRSRKMRGGYYQQYGSNIPNTPSYSTGGIISANESALANPVPYKVLGTCEGNCIDNYNHYTNRGFQI